MPYSFDTSVFITSWRRNYPPDVFSGLWNNFEQYISNGLIVATSEVQVELENQDDEVLEWAKQQQRLFIPLDSEIQREVSDILSKHPRLLDTRKNRSGADPFVIALAKVWGFSVVTFEKPTKSLSRPNIPDVCQALNVDCIDIVELARRELWEFR